MVAQILEVEIDDPGNRNLFFAPLGEIVRGRFDVLRMKDKDLGSLLEKYPNAIPGQRLRLNAETGEAALVDPLHDDEHASVAENIKAQGFSLGKAERVFPSVDVTTWLHWLKRLIDDGTARIVSGKLPAKIEGSMRTDFFTEAHPDPNEERIEKLVGSVDRLCCTVDKLVEYLGKAAQS